MSLRIAHNVEAMNAHRSLGVSADRLGKAMQRMSSGLRINSAADDAAGLGISEKMRAQIRGLERAGANIQDGISLLQTIDGALNEVHSILQRVRELAVQWNSGTLDTSAKAQIRTEVFALSDEIARIEQSTDFNGVKLLQNANAAITLQVGANDGETIMVSLADLFGPTVGNLVRPNTFLWVPWGDSDLDGIDMHIDDVSIARARFGAIQNRLEHALAANQQAVGNMMAAESRIRDVDMASEMVEFSKQQVLQQTSARMLLFADVTPARVLDLIAPERASRGGVGAGAASSTMGSFGSA